MYIRIRLRRSPKCRLPFPVVLQWKVGGSLLHLKIPGGGGSEPRASLSHLLRGVGTARLANQTRWRGVGTARLAFTPLEGGQNRAPRITPLEGDRSRPSRNRWMPFEHQPAGLVVASNLSHDGYGELVSDKVNLAKYWVYGSSYGKDSSRLGLVEARLTHQDLTGRQRRLLLLSDHAGQRQDTESL